MDIQADKTSQPGLSSKDFVSDSEIRWCPGCGDYSILKQVQTIMPDLGIKPENLVFISGIGCSSRFPYYMETYGMHSIHGRALPIASGLKAGRPDLSVWVATGDGDCLSIGGNHFIHALRRNFDINIILFNNQIYGLTKGQYSPTSPFATLNKTAPQGTIDYPINPLALAMGADGTFIARTLDREPKHLQAILKRAYEHKGTSFVEVYQNCNIFNDGAFKVYTDKETKMDNVLFLEQGKPLIFGQDANKGIKLDGNTPVIVDLAKDEDLWIHDETDMFKAGKLVRFFSIAHDGLPLPLPVGVLYKTNRPTYESLITQQAERFDDRDKDDYLDKIIAGSETWDIR